MTASISQATHSCGSPNTSGDFLPAKTAERMASQRNASLHTCAMGTAEADLDIGRGRKLFEPRCRYEGEEVAAVAAETPYQAWDAIRAIRVEYHRRQAPGCRSTVHCATGRPRETLWRQS